MLPSPNATFGQHLTSASILRKFRPASALSRILSTLKLMINANFRPVVQTLNMKCSKFEHYRVARSLVKWFLLRISKKSLWLVGVLYKAQKLLQ